MTTARKLQGQPRAIFSFNEKDSCIEEIDTVTGEVLGKFFVKAAHKKTYSGVRFAVIKK